MKLRLRRTLCRILLRANNIGIKITALTPLTSNISVPIDRLDYYDIEVIWYSIVLFCLLPIILPFLKELHFKYSFLR